VGTDRGQSPRKKRAIGCVDVGVALGGREGVGHQRVIPRAKTAGQHVTDVCGVGVHGMSSDVVGVATADGRMHTGRQPRGGLVETVLAPMVLMRV
jgi:hypothetical protein